RARGNLAFTIKALGDLPGARALEEKVLEVRSRALPEDHPDLQLTRANLAVTLQMLGDLLGARAHFEKVLEVYARTLPEDHPDLQLARQYLASICARALERERTAQVLDELSRGTSRAIRNAILHLSTREAEAAAESAHPRISTVLSLSTGAGLFACLEGIEPRAFELVESARGVAARSARLVRGARRLDEAEPLRREIEEASADVARASLGDGDAEKLFAAVRRKERAERAMREALASDSVVARLLEEVGPQEIGRSLGPEAAGVGFWRYQRWEPDPEDRSKERTTPCYLAYVLRHGQPLRRVELGGADRIEQAVEGWRRSVLASVGVARGVVGLRAQAETPRAQGTGEEVRRLVLDPLREALGNARRLVVILDDALHLVPIEALPEGEGVVGDRLEILYRSALWELVIPESGSLREPSLLALGGIDYEGGPGSRPARAPAAVGVEEATIAGGGTALGATRAWERGFPPLAATGEEVEGVASFFRATFPVAAPPQVLLARAGTKEALRTLAPRARFLHIATHAYFAPESVASIKDERPLDAKLGFGRLSSLEEQVRGLAPMVLCGLALAEANGPPDMYGRLPGVMTAEEVASLDLSGCELVVLSACETNVGVRRAGQGIASLQGAVHAAGARSALTSLWQLPDAVTRDLMVDFYRGIWVEGKTKAKALWDAKRKIRNRRDAKGNPAHATWEWAGLVLTGEP
ncbi:MAG TPA: CHAT domain-containing tetratricopeptide repeat protein, partial [Planctomycetota bacterium]|nr:CHAT domain-containing tetratricopeptide repeat protein [Planctomycetota bacterium]